MQYSNYIYNHSKVTIAKIDTGHADGEIHAIVTQTDAAKSFRSQLESLSEAIANMLSQEAKNSFSPVMIRLLLSDAANQAPEALEKIRRVAPEAALAYVQQPPMNGTKIAAWVYMMQSVSIKREDQHTVKACRGGRTHIWSANVCNAKADTLTEAHAQLEYLETMLAENGLNIADNCVRTWFYVQNIDVNYGGVVKARNDNFDANGLTVDTHYISSTGIGGRHADKNVTSIMDAYSIGGLEEGQMNYLYAADNMNRTSDYGVAFERGTYIDYADRRHVLISGTASIDNKGAVVAEGDIVAQTKRMIENVGALLSEAEASFDDVAHIVVYLRDTADYAVVREIFDGRFPDVPCVITYAPVCRPGWLIEMECMGIALRKSDYRAF